MAQKVVLFLVPKNSSEKVISLEIQISDFVFVFGTCYWNSLRVLSFDLQKQLVQTCHVEDVQRFMYKSS